MLCHLSILEESEGLEPPYCFQLTGFQDRNISRLCQLSAEDKVAQATRRCQLVKRKDPGSCSEVWRVSLASGIGAQQGFEP